LLATLDIDIQWFYHASRALKGVSDINLVPIVVFQPEEVHSYSTIILLNKQIISKLESIFGQETKFSCDGLSVLNQKETLQTSFQINEIANPFQICFMLPCASVFKESYDDTSFLSTAFHLRKAAAESTVFLKIIHPLSSHCESASLAFLPLDFRSLISFGFIYPFGINFLSAVEGISPAVVFSLILVHKFKFSVPLYSDKIIFLLKLLCLSRGIKYFSESEAEISPFLYPVKLDTGFLFRESLLHGFHQKWSIQTKFRHALPLGLIEGERSPDVITLALQISSLIKYSSPDIFTLTLSLIEGYDLSRRLCPALTLLIQFYEKEARSYQFILDLLINDVGGDFLIDIYKFVFDLVEAKLLQPGVAKIKI